MSFGIWLDVVTQGSHVSRGLKVFRIIRLTRLVKTIRLVRIFRCLARFGQVSVGLGEFHHDVKQYWLCKDGSVLSHPSRMGQMAPRSHIWASIDIEITELCLKLQEQKSQGGEVWQRIRWYTVYNIYIYIYTYRMDSVSIDIYIRATFVFGCFLRGGLEMCDRRWSHTVSMSGSLQQQYLFISICTYTALENIWFSERIGPSQVLCIEIWRSFTCQLAILDHMRWNKGPLPGPAPRIRSWHPGFVVALRTLVPWFKAWSLVDRRLSFFEYHPCTASIRYG